MGKISMIQIITSKEKAIAEFKRFNDQGAIYRQDILDTNREPADTYHAVYFNRKPEEYRLILDLNKGMPRISLVQGMEAFSVPISMQEFEELKAHHLHGLITEFLNTKP
jgi:hypothetical protein